MTDATQITGDREIDALLLSVYYAEGAALWMRSPNRLLDNERPVNLIQTEAGRDRVLALLTALAEGAFL